MSRQSFEKLLFASRWLLAPFYLALVLALLALMARVGVRVYELAIQVPTLSDDDVLLGGLGVVDLTLSASLIVIVILSGYVNFIAPIDIAAHKDWPHWFADVDFGELKLKLLASIVAIAAIKLLESFMDVDRVSDRELAWETGVLLAFVASAVVLALAEWIGHRRADQR